MLAPGFLMILLTGWVLDKLFIEEVDENADNRQKKVIKASKPVDWAAAMKVAVPVPAIAGPVKAAAIAAPPTPAKIAPPRVAPAKPGVTPAPAAAAAQAMKAAAVPVRKPLTAPPQTAEGK